MLHVDKAAYEDVASIHHAARTDTEASRSLMDAGFLASFVNRFSWRSIGSSLTRHISDSISTVEGHTRLMIFFDVA